MTSTLIEVIEQHAAQLEAAAVAYGQGTTNAFDEAAWLVLWALKLPLDQLDQVATRPLSQSEQTRIAQLIAQRIQTRQPAAYLTGEAWLQGVPFYIDPRTIVPRSLIAELIAQGSIDPWLSASTQRVLDLCTGNGSLAVLCALAYPEVSVCASDLSPDALAVAAINVKQHQLSTRITLVQADGLVGLPAPFDLIVCNPPYVNAASMAALPPEFLAEPTMALSGNTAGGIDGMDFLRHILPQLANALSPAGVVVIEIGHERAHFEAAFAHLNPVYLSTSAGDDQVLLLTAADLAGF